MVCLRCCFRKDLCNIIKYNQCHQIVHSQSIHLFIQSYLSPFLLVSLYSSLHPSLPLFVYLSFHPPCIPLYSSITLSFLSYPLPPPSNFIHPIIPPPSIYPFMYPSLHLFLHLSLPPYNRSFISSFMYPSLHFFLHLSPSSNRSFHSSPPSIPTFISPSFLPSL